MRTDIPKSQEINARMKRAGKKLHKQKIRCIANEADEVFRKIADEFGLNLDQKYGLGSMVHTMVMRAETAGYSRGYNKGYTAAKEAK